MLKARKLKRNVYILLATTLVGYVIFVRVFSEPDKYLDSKYKIALIEDSIKSRMNYGECKIPHLPLNDPEIMKFYSETEPLNCGDNEDWVVCEVLPVAGLIQGHFRFSRLQKSTCEVKATVLKEKGPINCWYTDLVRKSDYKTIYGKTTQTSTKYKLQGSDFAKVYCKAENGDKWFGIAIGIRDSVKLPTLTDKNVPFLNVLMIGFDSLSRNAFIRKLPKTYKYLTEKLGGHILQGYNIIGDGTPQALIPILTGFTELELPETRKRVRGSTYVNAYPMIWKDFNAAGYATAFNEDLPETGTFTYRLNGFDEQPTDHYMRTYYLEASSYLSSSKKFCLGNSPAHQVMLNYTKNFLMKYKTNPRFVFSFHGELSHDSINLIGMADDDLESWLRNLKDIGILEKTILILMSDHGNRFAEVRNTLQGKQEERLPLFSFVFPEIFKQQFSKEYSKFLQNFDVLTTPFDIHETLSDIIRMQTSSYSYPEYSKSRAISLFQQIPRNRSCADAYIEPHWCTCLNWIPVNHTNSQFGRSIGVAVVDKMNAFTETQRNVCEHLQLKQIHWITKLAPKENLLRFKKNLDKDGFLADLTSETKVSSEMYQVKITTLPGNSIFEASVLHDLNEEKFIVNLTDVSRVNKYGVQAACIYETYPELRKYCYCKTDA